MNIYIHSIYYFYLIQSILQLESMQWVHSVIQFTWGYSKLDSNICIFNIFYFCDIQAQSTFHINQTQRCAFIFKMCLPPSVGPSLFMCFIRCKFDYDQIYKFVLSLPITQKCISDYSLCHIMECFSKAGMLNFSVRLVTHCVSS